MQYLIHMVITDRKFRNLKAPYIPTGSHGILIQHYVIPIIGTIRKNIYKIIPSETTLIRIERLARS